MMDFLALARRRYSVRDFAPRPVTDAEIATVMEAAALAPTACNRQPFRFVVVRRRPLLDRLCCCYSGAWLATAPCIIVAVALPEEAWVRRQDGKNHAEIDLAIAVDHLTLAAATSGLGTCWICAFDVPATVQALSLPEDRIPVALVPLGAPADAPPPKTRKPAAELYTEA